MSYYDEDVIMQDADNEPSVRDFIRFLHSFQNEIMEDVDEKIDEMKGDVLQRSMEDIFIDSVVNNIVDRLYDLLLPTVGERVSRTIMENSIRIAPREIEGERWSVILRRLADQFEKGVE